MAVGRIPGLTLDRTGIALLGAIAMIEAGAMSFPQAVDAVDLPTIVLLYALMVVPAQLRLGGFYTRTAFNISGVRVLPRFFLLVSMLLIKFLDPARVEQWYALAVSSTFAGNLIAVGSIANLIVIEQAAACGVDISFRDHARVGISVTLAPWPCWPPGSEPDQPPPTF